MFLGRKRLKLYSCHSQNNLKSGSKTMSGSLEWIDEITSYTQISVSLLKKVSALVLASIQMSSFITGSYTWKSPATIFYFNLQKALVGLLNLYRALAYISTNALQQSLFGIQVHCQCCPIDLQIIVRINFSLHITQKFSRENVFGSSQENQDTLFQKTKGCNLCFYFTMLS